MVETIAVALRRAIDLVLEKTFEMALRRAVDFVLKNLERMHGGEVFVPKIPSYRLIDVAKAIAPEAKFDFIGIRPGEKLHEMMIPEDEARQTLEFDDYFIIQPNFEWCITEDFLKQNGGTFCADNFSYRSDTNEEWLSIDDIKQLVNEWSEENNG